MLTNKISKILGFQKNVLLSGCSLFRFSAFVSKDGVTIETNQLEALMREEKERLVIFNATINRREYDPRLDHIKERISSSLWFDLKGLCE